MNIDLRREWPAFLALVLAFIGTALLFSRLPDPMPTHWNAAGVADGYSSRRVGAWLMPLTAVGMYLLMVVLPRLDPRRANIERFSDTYALLRVGITIFFVLIQGLILYSALTDEVRLNPAIMLLGIGALFVVIGNYMPRMRSNWFMGIRTPWTLSSERVWTRTHRVGGRLFVLAGLVTIAAALIAPETGIWFVIGASLLAGLVPVVYSYMLYRQEEQVRP